MASKVDLQKDYEKAIEGGAVEAENNSFGTEVRNMDAGDPLTVGDVITIPQNYKVLKTTVGEAPKDGSEQKLHSFIIVSVKNKDTGTEKSVRFFPNQLAKVVFPIENGKRLPKVKTTGSVAEAYAKFANADDAFKSFTAKGDCEIEVSRDDEYTYHDRFNNRDRQTHIYQYNFVAA